MRFIKFSKSSLVTVLCLSSAGMNLILGWLAWPSIKTNILHWGDDDKQVTKMPITKVRIATVKRAAMARKITLSGTVKAIDVVPIMSEIQGKIAKINFKEGEMVPKGSLLIQLDDRQALADLMDAKAREKHAVAQYDRQKLLMQKKYGSPSAVEKAEAEWAMAKAAVEKAQVQLQHTRIVAPFEGEIGLRNISVGGYIAPNQEITRLVRSNPIEIDFQVPESDAGKISEGQEVEMTAEGFESLPSTAIVTAVEPYSDPIAHTVRVRAQMDNPDNKIKDGAFARVTISLAREEEALVVPQDAILREADQSYVFVVVNNRVFQRPVETGIQEGDQIEIVDGVPEGTIVAVDPIEYLGDGIPVETVTSE